VPQPWGTFDTPVRLTGAIDTIADKRFILADRWDPSPFRHFAARVADLPGWRLTVMPTGHDIMVDMPGELASELLTLG
jgi:hypothetical protein